MSCAEAGIMRFLCAEDDEPVPVERVVAHIATVLGVDVLGTTPCWLARSVAAAADQYTLLYRIGGVGRLLADTVAPLGYITLKLVNKVVEKLEPGNSFACGDTLVAIVDGAADAPILFIETADGAALYAIVDRATAEETLRRHCRRCSEAQEECRKLAEILQDA